jgi:Uma2 family endonuclease
MYAVISPQKIQLPPGTTVRMEGTWDDYCRLCESRGDDSFPRIKFHNGEILLMSPLPRHGREVHLLARIIELLLDQEDLSYEAFTPITMSIPEEDGIEPDYCFYITHCSEVLGKDRIDWQVDPPPDLVIEVDVFSYTSAEDYLPYKVPEVWILKHKVLKIYGLVENGYELRSHSIYFPGIDVPELMSQVLEVANAKGSGLAIRELRQRHSAG